MIAIMDQATPTHAEIIQAHQRDVWRFLVALGCEANEADDLTQETFLAVLRGEFRYLGPRETAAWLRRVAKNLFVSGIRKRGRAAMVPNLDDADAHWGEFSEQADGDERVLLLRECMGDLTDRSREALRLRYELELDRAEMARRLDMKEAGVKTLLERLRDKLRECVMRRLGASHDL